ncbi:MAG: hypothetical protein ABI311_12825, partial [Gemmatimonadaceae bacterium]
MQSFWATVPPSTSTPLAMLRHTIRRALAGTTCAFSAFVPVNRVHTPPPIRHVFIIVLENESFETTFGAGSPAPYLADTLTKAGAFLRQYYGTGHSSLDNYISMISGIAP